MAGFHVYSFSPWWVHFISERNTPKSSPIVVDDKIGHLGLISDQNLLMSHGNPFLIFAVKVCCTNPLTFAVQINLHDGHANFHA